MLLQFFLLIFLFGPGASDKETKIGGWTMDITNVPFHVAVVHWQSVGSNEKIGYWRYGCGGSIIGEKWILTAASCFLEDKLTVAVGRNDVDFGPQWLTGSDFVEIDRLIPHPESQDSGSGIGLIELVKGLNFEGENKMKAAVLPPSSFAYVDRSQLCSVAFGEDNLKGMCGFLWNFGECYDDLDESKKDTRLCIRNIVDEPTAICGAVPGSGITSKKGEIFLLLGVISGKDTDCLTNRTVKAVNLVHYTEWISSIIHR